MEEIDRIYILVHPEFEKDRYERLKQHLAAKGLPPDKTVIGATTWGSTLSSELIFTAWDPFLRPGIPNMTWKSRFLSRGEISLVLNFYAVARDAVQNKFKNVLIFESDVYLRDDFVERFGVLWKDLGQKEWDYVSLGEGVSTRPDSAIMSYWSETKAYVPPHMCVFRCTDSMLFKVSMLEKIVGTIIPFRECLDWELNYQLALHGGKALWADPPLVEQGSGRNRDASLLPA